MSGLCPNCGKWPTVKHPADIPELNVKGESYTVIKCAHCGIELLIKRYTVVHYDAYYTENSARQMREKPGNANI